LNQLLVAISPVNASYLDELVADLDGLIWVSFVPLLHETHLPKFLNGERMRVHVAPQICPNGHALMGRSHVKLNRERLLVGSLALRLPLLCRERRHRNHRPAVRLLLTLRLQEGRPWHRAYYRQLRMPGTLETDLQDFLHSWTLRLQSPELLLEVLNQLLVAISPVNASYLDELVADLDGLIWVSFVPLLHETHLPKLLNGERLRVCLAPQICPNGHAIMGCGHVKLNRERLLVSGLALRLPLLCRERRHRNRRPAVRLLLSLRLQEGSLRLRALSRHDEGSHRHG